VRVMPAHPGLYVTCPTCGATGIAFEFITRDWDGRTYGFACGHQHHLDPSKGGAETHLQATSAKDAQAKETARRELRMPRVDVRYEDGSIEVS
jgi:hypothetical protein